MQKCFIKLAILSCLLASSSASARGDGSLPLGRGDGSLPLRTIGSAVEMKDTPDAIEILTKVIVTQLSEEKDELLLCDSDQPATIAMGQISVGGKSYDIQGLCFDAETTNITIFATHFGENGLEKAQVRGLLEDGEQRSLTGRLTITKPNVRSTRFLINAQEEAPVAETEITDNAASRAAH